MPRSFNVVQYGVGPIGQLCLKTLLSKPGHINLVGAIDIDPDKVGKDVADVLGLDTPTGVIISGDAAGVLSKTKA